MVSLTPQSRSDEVTGDAMNEGLINGGLVLACSQGLLYFGMQNENFRKFTNWQSRTAMVVMPALFAFTFSSENRMVHRMKEVANETEHALQTVEWADREHRRRQTQRGSVASEHAQKEKEESLRTLYRKAIHDSAVRIVPGTSLGPHHQVANYIQENPFKLLATVGIPSVAYIFWGRTTKEHLNFQMKLLHTRVYGQFTIICMLLSIMGIKEFMDRSGKYMTEGDVEQRVEDMVKTRQSMLARLEYQAAEDQKRQSPARN